MLFILFIVIFFTSLSTYLDLRNAFLSYHWDRTSYHMHIVLNEKLYSEKKISAFLFVDKNMGNKENV